MTDRSQGSEGSKPSTELDLDAVGRLEHYLSEHGVDHEHGGAPRPPATRWGATRSEAEGGARGAVHMRCCPPVHGA